MSNSTLKENIEAFREEFDVICCRLALIRDGLTVDPNNPDPFSVQGAVSMLTDTIGMLDGMTSRLWEESALADYLNCACEEATAQPN